MPESISFTSTGFSLESVSVLGPASLGVRFTYAPLQSSPSGLNDALNVTNYALTGPSPVAIVSAATDPSDVQTIILTLSGPLASGTWMLAASTNIQTPVATPLGSPTSQVFT